VNVSHSLDGQFQIRGLCREQSIGGWTERLASAQRELIVTAAVVVLLLCAIWPPRCCTGPRS